MALRRPVTMLSMSAFVAMVFLAVSASAESKARIVRLSEVQGAVQIDRATGDGFGKAFMNLPVVEGSRVKTGEDGRAEIEFEDGSALRLAPNSEVDFIRLALGDDGQKLSAVQLVSGTIYGNLHPKKTSQKDGMGDDCHLIVADETVSVAAASHFRVEFNDANQATVAVLKGKVSAAGPSGQFEVAEKHSATIKFAKDKVAESDPARPAKKDTFTIAKNYDSEPSDEWDRQQTDYHDQYAVVGATNSSSPYGYGMSDLNYYGSFLNLPGYGNVWQPYFIGANWSPFQDGAWAFYPGAGYTWVSGYPWGWMPYRYGSWAFASGFGWFWQPGYGTSYYMLPQVTNAPLGAVVPAAPITGHETIMVGRGLTADPAAGIPEHLTIRPGSAGFGVPRGSVGHLDRVAKSMQRTARPEVVRTIQPASSLAYGSGFGANAPSMAGTSAVGARTSGRASTAVSPVHPH